MEKLVEIENLKISFQTYNGSVEAVRDISFSIPKGKTIAIVGESGCGKSVTAKAIMGLIQKPGIVAEYSKVLFENENINRFTEKQLRVYRGKECAMIFQDALIALNPTMKIGRQISDNLKNHSNMSRKEMKSKVIEILRLVGIPDPEECIKKYPHELSGGMRQRVMIATALITTPKLLIADEPTTALDVTIQAQIMELIKQLQKKFRMTTILITHDLGVVADSADEILVMYAGKIVEQGTCDEIFYDTSHPYTWALLNSIPYLEQESKTTLTTIEGGIPDLISPPKGCSFAARCPYTMNICIQRCPELRKINDNHKCSCWLLDKDADISDVPFKVRKIKNE